MSNPLSSTLLLKRKLIKRCTPVTNACHFLGVYDGSSCEEEPSVFTPRPVFWSWDLQGAAKPYSPKNCCWTMPSCSTTKEHFPQCSLHCGLQEPSGSIGSAQRAPSIVSHHVERQFGHLSSCHDATLRVFGTGFASGLLR